MSNSLELELKVRTGAAKQASDDVAAAIHGVTDASEAAGKSTQKLGKQVAVTRGQQLEAVEALRRAKDAQSELTLTEQAYGKKSSEAAAAKKRLIAAQAEATKAAIVAASSLERVSKATAAAAKAEEGDLTPATKRAAAQIARMSKDAERAAGDLHKMDLQAIAASKGTDKLAKGITAMQVAGGALLARGVEAGIGGIGRGIKAAATEAIDFQTQMTGIAKVLDDQSPENLAKVDAQIKSMAVSLGMLPTELAAGTQALAASGLQNDLVGYTEDAAKLGVALDLSGQEAGHAIASLTASLGLSRGEMQSLMGTVNELDDGMNSSSKQLVEYLEGVAGIGRSASISGETMLALGSAIISTGTAPDKAATGVKNFIATMESGKAATTAQVEAFHKLGFEAEAAAQQMATGHAETQIKKISEALAGLPPEERFATMIDLFGKESIGSVGGLATNVDLLGQAFKIAGDKAAAAGSVQAEYERVSQTTAQTLAQLKANVSVAAIEVGSVLLPEINAIAKDMSAWVTENRELIKVNVAGAVKTITGAAKDLWPVLKTVASTVTAVTSAVGAGNLAYLAMGAKVVSLTNDVGGFAAKAVTTLIPALGGIGGKLGKLAGPAGLFVAGAAGVAALTFETLKLGQSWAKSIMSTDSQSEAFERLAASAQEANIRMTAVRLEAMRNAADKLGASNDALAKDNARKKKIIEAGYTDEGMAEAAAAAGMAARRKALHGRRISQLNDEQKDLVRASVERAMVGEKLAYMERADKAGSDVGTANTPIADKPKKGKGGAKKKSTLAEDSYDLDVDLQQYSTKVMKEHREADIKSREEQVEAALAAEERMHESATLAIDREKELFDAGISSREDAAAAHESFLARKIAADEKYARQQLKIAKTEEQRDKAQTRLENAEHSKRLLAVKKRQRAEEELYESKLAVVNKVTAGVTSLTGAMVEGAWKAAEGQKGALWMVVGEELKATARRYSIKAAAEFASAAIAAAGIVTAPLAPAHVVAGGMALGVAALAGGAGFVAAKIGEARADSGGKSKKTVQEPDEDGTRSVKDIDKEMRGIDARAIFPHKGDKARRAELRLERENISSQSGSGSSSGGKSGGDSTFEKSEIPQSFNDRNPAQSGGDGERVFNITVNVGNLMGKDSKQLGRDLLKAIREAEGAGKKV